MTTTDQAAPIDLTPFGFTPTESSAYRALLERGPLGGYALGKALSIARANAYQALNGLEAKGAAEPTPDVPKRFRPLHPEALLVAILDQQARRIDALEVALRRAPESAATPGVAPIASPRTLEDLIIRSAARTRQPVWCAGPVSLLQRLSPVWHKRKADGTETRIWTVGATNGAQDLPILPDGALGPPEVAEGTTLAVMGPVMMVGVVEGRQARGFWSNEPLQVWLAQLAFRSLTT